MPRAYPGIVLASGLMLIALALAPHPVSAGDEAKHECRQGCGEAQRSCKADCGSRDSGDLQASQRWVDCDADCHESYAACVDACADE